MLVNLTDTDADIGELDGQNYPHLKLKASKLVHQSFPEVNSLAPNPLQPFYHLLPLNLVKINHFTITSWCWNYEMQFCQTLKASPVLCLTWKHPTTKDGKKVLSNRGLFEKYHDWNHMITCGEILYKLILGQHDEIFIALSSSTVMVVIVNFSLVLSGHFTR